MKTFTKFLTMLAVAALFATGCVNEEPPYKEDPNPEPAGTTGYLSIGNLSMTVVYDETEIRPDDTSDETQAARTASGTRATAPDVDSFIVEILDADNAQVLEMTYAELKEQLKTPMELKVGAYRMEVRSEDTMPGVDWELPVYGATSDFTITKAQTTSPEEVVCTLQNIKVSVEYSPELADMLADTSKATVSLGDTSLDFLKTETRAAYFKPQALENTLDFVFDGTFADTDVPAKFSKQITGVKAGQWRKVSVVIGYADKGNILFSVKVDNSILQDNKFVVDGTENLGEELLEDPNAPALTWPGHDMTQPFTLTDAMFDAEGELHRAVRIRPLLAQRHRIAASDRRLHQQPVPGVDGRHPVARNIRPLRPRRIFGGRDYPQGLRLPRRQRAQRTDGQEFQHRRADQGAL